MPRNTNTDTNAFHQPIFNLLIGLLECICSHQSVNCVTGSCNLPTNMTAHHRFAAAAVTGLSNTVHLNINTATLTGLVLI